MVGGFFEVEYQFKLRDMFSAQADKIVAKFDKVRDAATRANKRFTELSKNVRGSSENLKQLNSNIKPVNMGLATMDKSSKAVTASVKAQTQALKVQAATLRHNSAMMRDYNRYAGVMMQAGQGLFRTGNMLGLTVTAPIVGAAFAGGKAFIGREERAAQVRKTAGLSKANAAYLISEANKYSGRNPTSTEEILDISGILGQAGLGSDSKAGVMELMKKSETVAKMMAAFDMTSEQAGTSFSKMYTITESLMNANPKSRLYGKFNDNYFNRLIDFIDNQENDNPVNASQIFEAMKTRTLASGLMIPGQMDPFESAIFTTQMLKYKSASRGSNIINQLNKDMANPKKVGEELAQTFRDSPMKALIKFGEVFKSKTPGKAYDLALQVSKSYAGEFTSVMASVDKMKESLVLAEELKKIAEEEERTGIKRTGPLTYKGKEFGLDASYLIKSSTFMSKLSVLGNNLSNFLANFFERVEPYLNKFLDYITPKVYALSESIKNMDEKRFVVLISAITSLALLAPALMILGSVLNTIAATIKAISVINSTNLGAVFKEVQSFILNILGFKADPTKIDPILQSKGGSPRSIPYGGPGSTPNSNKLPLKDLKPPKKSLPKSFLDKIFKFKSKLPKLGGGVFSKIFGGLGKAFLPAAVISSVLEGAITGKWMESLFAGGGGILGGAAGGALAGLVGGGPLGMLLGGLGGAFMGSGMGRDLGKGITKMFPEIDKTFIASLKAVNNIFQIIIGSVKYLWNDLTGMFGEMGRGIDGFLRKSPIAQGAVDLLRGAIHWLYNEILVANKKLEDLIANLNILNASGNAEQRAAELSAAQKKARDAYNDLGAKNGGKNLSNAPLTPTTYHEFKFELPPNVKLHHRGPSSVGFKQNPNTGSFTFNPMRHLGN